jgi:hypothetical protein
MGRGGWDCVGLDFDDSRQRFCGWRGLLAQHGLVLIYWEIFCASSI